MDAQIRDGAGFGRANYCSAEHFACRLNTLEELENLGLSVAQGLGDLGVMVALQLEDHRVRFSDGLLGSRNLGQCVANPSVNLGLFALELQETRARLQSLGDHGGDGRHLLLDDRRALRGRFHLKAQRGDFLASSEPCAAE